jgi:hypothetical protein
MNWPPLTPDCSKAVAEVLRDAVRTRPQDLFEYVAQKLEERSGMDAANFQAQFEEAKRKPRTYVLEEQCPPGQEPLSWVPMRYNDDTILSMLQARASEMSADIISEELIEDTQSFVARARVSFPELMYLRGLPDLELAAAQTLRALYLGCSGNVNVVELGLDDADPMLAFRCRPLVTSARTLLFEQTKRTQPTVDALIVCSLLLVVGRHPGFQQRYGGGQRTPELAVIHAIEHEAESLPSFACLGHAQRQLVLAALQAYFPMEMLLSAEVVPAHFGRVKDLLTVRENGMEFFFAVLGIEHMVRCRSTIVSDASVELVALGVQCLKAVEKYSAARGYELYLKKRAAPHSWRLVRDDFIQRAIIRLCCFRGIEEDEAWNDMLTAVDGLGDASEEHKILKTELGQKDGLADVPVYVLQGAGALMVAAGANSDVGLQPAVKVMCRAIDDVTQTFGKVLNHKVVRIRLESLATKAAQYKAGGGSPFADTPFTLEEVGAGEVAVKIPGL